jgi:NAD(P)-dependent dehydrogenase (short-subunit alcohol dehydrogenase family)
LDIAGKSALVLGGAGLVGTAVCRELIAAAPARLVVAARREERAREAVEQLRAERPAPSVEIVPAWGDVFLRAGPPAHGAVTRARVLADPVARRRLVDDILAPLDEDTVSESCLVQLITGRTATLGEVPARIVVDCINTATALSYQDIYSTATRVRELAARNAAQTDWTAEVERMLAAMPVPQLVRHVQLLHEGMRRAGTEAYIKVGTTGSGGFGFNIPYTHGEERPSRLLLSKSAVAGAQALLTFLMARTPDAPVVVKQVLPAACIGWREIGHGPIRRHGREVERCDCPPELAVSRSDPASLVPEGAFGERLGEPLAAVYIDTGENGVFSADEFVTITAPGQMQLVTAEEIAVNVVRELRGASTGREVVAALDASVMGPSHRGGHLRLAAIERLRQLEAEHGRAVAFEILGPPRLLFEAHLLERALQTMSAVLACSAPEVAAALEGEVLGDPDLRQRMLSIGVPILLPDGERLLRGPQIKASSAEDGWVDLGASNMRRWQQRLEAIREQLRVDLAGDTSSRHDRCFAASRAWHSGDAIVPGELAAWILTREQQGQRQKS